MITYGIDNGKNGGIVSLYPDGMMEVPIAIGVKQTGDDDNGLTVKKIGLKFNDPTIKIKRVDTCRIFCSCKRGCIERKLYGEFFPVDSQLYEHAYDYIKPQEDKEKTHVNGYIK